MLSVVIPTGNSEEALARTLASLVPAAADGTVREVIVADAGSTDATVRVADGAGCVIVQSGPDLASCLAAGAAAAYRGEFILFLAAGVAPEAGWEADLAALMERLERRGRPFGGVVFRYAVDDVGLFAGLRQTAVRTIASITGLPHFDQGLIVRRSMLAGLGATIADRPTLAGLIRRIGRRRVISLRSTACRIAADGLTGSWFPGAGRSL